MDKPKSKKDNALQLDPARFKVAQSMSTVPGGPMNTQPHLLEQAHGERLLQAPMVSGGNT